MSSAGTPAAVAKGPKIASMNRIGMRGHPRHGFEQDEP
jgi:hypothetical protein